MMQSGYENESFQRIVREYREPYNYVGEELSSPSVRNSLCGDQISIKHRGGQYSFSGTGCALCMSSTSFLVRFLSTEGAYKLGVAEHIRALTPEKLFRVVEKQVLKEEAGLFNDFLSGERSSCVLLPYKFFINYISEIL